MKWPKSKHNRRWRRMMARRICMARAIMAARLRAMEEMHRLLLQKIADKVSDDMNLPPEHRPIVRIK